MATGEAWGGEHILAETEWLQYQFSTQQPATCCNHCLPISTTSYDISSLAATAEFAEHVNRDMTKLKMDIDCLVNNAGVFEVRTN